MLARIPLLKSSQLRGRQASGWHMLPAVREAFRTLMIQLGPHPEGRAHVVMVTSASTGDGKTTSAVNLAAAAAASGDPVILLDFDLRKPDVGRTLGVQPGTELTGLLQPDTQLRDLLSPAPGLPALSVLTTTVAEGDVALVEALSRRLPELIADARELCNYVVIDTAPIGEISDALRLVGDVDSIIVVTKPGNTNRANFEMMRDLLERTAYTPAGFLVIGDSTPRTSAYYAYGATGRELFLQDPTPGGDAPRPRPAPTKSSSEIVSDAAGERAASSDRPVGAAPTAWPLAPASGRAPRREATRGTAGDREKAPPWPRKRPAAEAKKPVEDAKRPAEDAKRPADEVKRPAENVKASNNGEGDGARPASDRPGAENGPRRARGGHTAAPHARRARMSAAPARTSRRAPKTVPRRTDRRTCAAAAFGPTLRPLALGDALVQDSGMLKRGVAGLVGLGLVGGAGAAGYSDDGSPTVKTRTSVATINRRARDSGQGALPPAAAHKLWPHDIRAGRITLTLRRVRRREKAIERRYPSRDDALPCTVANARRPRRRDDRLVAAFNEQIKRRNAIIDEECE